MAELSPADRARQYSLRVLLEQTDGWKYVLERVFAHMQQYEAQTGMGWPVDHRLGNMAKKEALMALVTALYAEAQVESPFVKHHAALLAGFRPQDAREDNSEGQVAPLLDKANARVQAETVARLSQRRSSGSVV